MDFIKVVKVDEIYNILKSASNCLLVEWSRWKWMIQVFAGVCPWMPIRLLRPSFIKGQASSRKKNSCKEKVSYCNMDDTGAR